MSCAARRVKKVGQHWSNCWTVGLYLVGFHIIILAGKTNI